ncbi:PTS sugar transporter subunit IIA [uncultured Enorma sp.]|uniref:PTS sugar transporter subunit IIA n=1 Tax=uncultured Enorma sp. TaxID=1714346 RepID=UPI002803C8A0|nr:PTS sugar transporter subunit IIA [uncultured Enorma sp.]
MMLRSRQVALLARLVQNGLAFETTKHLAEYLAVSQRTVGSDLEVVSRLLDELGIGFERVRGKGVRLAPTSPERMHRLVTRLKQNIASTSPKARREEILERLVTRSEEPVSIQRLADSYFVSKTSIASDLRTVEKTLADYGLRLRRGPAGTTVEGRETDLRRALADILGIRSRRQAPFAPSSPPSGNRLNDRSRESLLELFDEESVDFVQSLIDDLERSTKTLIGDPYYVNLLTHLLICIDRVKKGKSVSADAADARSVDPEHLDLYLHAIDLRTSIEGRFDIKLNARETDYIFGYLVSFGIGRNASEGCQGEGDNQVLIDLLVRVVSHFTGQVVAPSETLRSELALHINAMLDRVRYGVRITNDYLEQFAGLHPRLLTLIEFACWGFTMDVSYPSIGVDEAAYLAMYCQTIVEGTHASSRVALVCQSGYGTSQFLKSRIRALLPDIVVIDALSVEELAQTAAGMYDFAISTVRIEHAPVPVVLVSALLDRDDIERIRFSGLLRDKVAQPVRPLLGSQDIEVSIAGAAQGVGGGAPERAACELRLVDADMREGITCAIDPRQRTPRARIVDATDTNLVREVRIIAANGREVACACADWMKLSAEGSTSWRNDAAADAEPRAFRLVAVAHAPQHTQGELLASLAERLECIGAIDDIPQFLVDVAARDELGSTNLGGGLVLPHGISRSVRHPAIAFATLAQAIEWTSCGAVFEVRLVALAAMPRERSGNAYIELLAALADVADDAQVIEELLALDDAAELEASLRELLFGVTDRDGASASVSGALAPNGKVG